MAYPDTDTPPSTNPGVLAGAMPDISQVSGTTYNPALAQPAGGASVNTNAATGSTTGYSAQQAGVTNWDVNDPQTVQGQVRGIIAENSPLQQQAEARALQQQNARGLLNSSMAVGAGQSALYDAALPIAQQDASTYANAAKTNAGEANTTGRFNTDQSNAAAQFTSQAANTQNLANQSAEQQANMASAAAQNQQTLANQSAAQQAGLANQAAQNAAAQWAAQTGFQSQIANQDAGVKTALTQYDGQLKLLMQNADSATRVQLQQIDANVRERIAGIEAQYKQAMQGSASMTSTYQNMIDAFTKVMQDKDMDAGSKQNAIANLTTLYNNALQIQNVTSGLNLGQLIDPGVFGVSAPAPAPEPAPAPAPSGGYGPGGGPDGGGDGGGASAGE